MFQVKNRFLITDYSREMLASTLKSGDKASFDVAGVILNFTRNTSILFTSSKMRYELYTCMQLVMHHNILIHAQLR